MSRTSSGSDRIRRSSPSTTTASCSMLAAAPPTVEIRALLPEDWSAVADIYWDGMRDGLATFQTEVPAWADWDEGHLPGHRLVAELFDEVVGWAALSPASKRRCYAGVVEHVVYDD